MSCIHGGINRIRHGFKVYFQTTTCVSKFFISVETSLNDKQTKKGNCFVSCFFFYIHILIKGYIISERKEEIYLSTEDVRKE